MTVRRTLTGFFLIGAIATCLALRFDGQSVWKSDPIGRERNRLRDELDSLKAEVEPQLQQTSESIRQIQSAITSASTKVAQLTAQLKAVQQAADRQQQRLDQYSDFLSKDEGAVLPDGSYVPVHDIREQAAFDAQHQERLRMTAATLNDQLQAAMRYHGSLEARRERLVGLHGELQETVHQIDDQLHQLKTVESIALDGGVGSDPERRLIRLQLSIHGVQDQINALRGVLPELDPTEKDVDISIGASGR